MWRQQARQEYIQLLTNAASIIGLFMVGGLVANSVKLSLAFSWEAAGGPLPFRASLTRLCQNFLPLQPPFWLHTQLRKKANANLIMILIIVLSIVGKWIGLF